MEIILKQDVDNLGDAGDIVTVADGYATNYLVPQGLAMRATKGAVADAAALKRARLKREAKSIADATALREHLEGKRFVVDANAGPDGTLYGSVGSRDVAEVVQAQTGTTLDHKKIRLDRPIKQVGEHSVDVRLHREVIASLLIDVRGELVEQEADEQVVEEVEELSYAELAEQAVEPAADRPSSEEDEVTEG